MPFLRILNLEKSQLCSSRLYSASMFLGLYNLHAQVLSMFLFNIYLFIFFFFDVSSR